MDFFNIVLDTPLWYQSWFWGTMASAVLLLFVKFTILPAEDITKNQTAPTVHVEGSVGGDLVLGDKSGYAEPEKTLKQKHANLKVERLLEDFSDYLKHVSEQHRKEIDQVAQRHVVRNTYSSGPHIREQYELARTRRREISRKQTELKRNIEDELLSLGQLNLTDEALQRRYAAVEAEAEQAQAGVLDATHAYFASRSHTFPPVAELEKLRQAILDDKSI